MSNISTKAKRTRHRESIKADAVAALAAAPELLGEIVIWRSARNRRLTLDEVKAALAASGHDEKYARTFKPEHAFTRAIAQLEEERLIDEVGRTDDEIIFQYTKTAIKKLTASEGEKTFDKEAKLELNRKTGRVKCSAPELEQAAQRELDRAINERTTSDITNIVQRLFDDYAANNPTGCLIPARDQGGAYLVIADHLPFVDRVNSFLKALGGDMNRWPIPKGTVNGDASTARSIKEMFDSMVAQAENEIKTFGENTRASTLEDAAHKIVESRVKLEAFASYLGELKGGLDTTLAGLRTKLINKINEITDQKSKSPDTDEEGGDAIGEEQGATGGGSSLD